MTTTPYGFRVVGHRASARRCVTHAAAFAAYAECDDRANVDREAYLSHFVYPAEFRRLLEQERSEKGYDGPCWAPVLWFDIDRPGDLEPALHDSRRLCGVILDRYPEVDEGDMLIHLSGGKGIHVGLPTSFWNPDPSPVFHDAAKRFALAHAERAGVVIDRMIYSKTRLFRAPNSRHPKSGLHKRRLSLDELTHLTPEAITRMAERPEPFEIPSPTSASRAAADDWGAACRSAEHRAAGRREHYSEDNTHLNALTLDFIRNGAGEGERANRLFSAAANLAEFGCPADLARALLTEAALDSGLKPSEVRRQIECGLGHGTAKETSLP